ncbi:serine hydrolase [Nonomuraea insulae]|uniref:Serine hydrolase n=1 Tax=Nonomuraea insulae TaxID=1616787 RepID=A0ABW1CCP2_9ACTN
MIGPEGRFRIAGMSKPIMAATVLSLAGRKIDLDAPVERYLPGVLRGTGIADTPVKRQHLIDAFDAAMCAR